jgi:hypothetical protein
MRRAARDQRVVPFGESTDQVVPHAATERRDIELLVESCNERRAALGETKVHKVVIRYHLALRGEQGTLCQQHRSLFEVAQDVFGGDRMICPDCRAVRDKSAAD